MLKDRIYTHYIEGEIDAQRQDLYASQFRRDRCLKIGFIRITIQERQILKFGIYTHHNLGEIETQRLDLYASQFRRDTYSNVWIYTHHIVGEIDTQTLDLYAFERVRFDIYIVLPQLLYRSTNFNSVKLENLLQHIMTLSQHNTRIQIQANHISYNTITKQSHHHNSIPQNTNIYKQKF